MEIDFSPAGNIVHSPKGYRAYVPNPLPPVINWDNKLAGALARANFLLGKLAREGSRLPNPHLLMRPFITREAVLSSRIEGTMASIGQVLAHSVGITTQQHPGDLQEVQNYITALDIGLKRLQEIPLSLRLIKEIHEQLMQGVRGAHATPGEFRRSQNWIGSPGSTLNTATFVPPPVDYLMDCLSDFEKFLHNRQLPSLIHIALCHYQFEAIHPFLDGNGRVGRLLISLLLVEQELLPAPLLYLSAFFEATRDEYYRQLLSVSTKGTWHDWLMYFLQGVGLQAEDVLMRAERINTLLLAWKLQMVGSSASVALDIIDQCAVNPYLTISSIAKQLNVAYSTAQRGVRKLEAAGIIKQVGNGKRDKVYCAIALLAILEEPTNITTAL